jgi:parallel beta-helix repeat protein
MQGNDCSDNQGWGIHVFRSSNNTIKNNRADNVNLDASADCVRDQQGACDTAGILVIKVSNSNLIQNNSFKNGGDGIFSAALGPPGNTQYGADHNRYIGNDVSFAKHLGIEATFADDVVVEGNTINNVGRSGVWLGGSKNSIIRNNTINGSGWSGIENEGTRNFTIENNRITNSAQNGIFLRDLQACCGLPSSGQFITKNTITGSGEYGIRANDTQSMNAPGNKFSGNGLGSVHLELIHESQLTGPIAINESNLLDATHACGGVDVKCGCRVFNGNAAGCNAAPGCQYFACSNRCEVAGTSQCDAGCGGCTGNCHDHDGNVEACDNDPGECAYYFCSNRCYPTGTPLEEACLCESHNGDPTGCNATPGCSFFACSNSCFFTGTPTCQANCCNNGAGVDCPIANVTNVTSNYWGTTNASVIDAAICGANLNFVPFKTAPVP